MGLHNHRNLKQAGECPTCRQYNIALECDAPHTFVAIFPDSDQVAFVRSWNPDGAIETAWATGCNAGGVVGWVPIDPDDPIVADQPWFTLLGPPVSTRWITYARDVLAAGGAVCSCCGKPMCDELGAS